MRLVPRWGSLNIPLALITFLLPKADGGISGLKSWFSGAFPNATSKLETGVCETFDHVCFDMNEILHTSLRRANNEDHAIKRIFKEVNRVLRFCQPTKSIVFAFDGSAPLAKLMVQRSRRASTAKHSRYLMSPLHLTPGTDFMERVAKAMEYYAFQCIQDNYRYSHVRFYISGASVPGEGELKCIDWVKLSMLPGTEESTVIVGGDADLILQGLALSKVKNLFIFDLVQGYKGQLVSLWEVVRSLEATFPGQSEHMRADLLLLLVLNGNDYLPKVRGMSFKRCYKAYLRTLLKNGKDQFLLDAGNRTFNWEFTKEFFLNIADHSSVPDAEEVLLNQENPSPVQLLNQAVAQGRFPNTTEIFSIDAAECESESKGGGGGKGDAKVGVQCLWRTNATVGGQEFSWEHSARSKKLAVQEAATFLLEEFVPDVHQQYLEQQAAFEATLALEAQDIGEGGQREDTATIEDQRDQAHKAIRSRYGQLFDVPTYLKGLLWNLQMYVDGYTPDVYWRYTLPFAPSCHEMANWIDKNPGQLEDIIAPLSPIPPLPSAVACLGLLPLTDAEGGLEYLPKRLAPLVADGSPVAEVLENSDPKEGFSVPRLLKAVQSVAPEELDVFWGRRHWQEAWTVLQGTGLPTSGTPGSGQQFSKPDRIVRAPPPPSSVMPNRSPRGVMAMTMAGTGKPPCHAWSNPFDPESWQQPGPVQDISYKRIYTTTSASTSTNGYKPNRKAQGRRHKKDGEGSRQGRSPRRGGAQAQGGTGNAWRQASRPPHRKKVDGSVGNVGVPQSVPGLGPAMCAGWCRPHCRLRV